MSAERSDKRSIEAARESATLSEACSVAIGGKILDRNPHLPTTTDATRSFWTDHISQN
jgi:hypothetical protein